MPGTEWIVASGIDGGAAGLRGDTAAMTVKSVVSEKGNSEFGAATVGLQISDEMFVGTFRGDRIAYFPLK